MIDKKLFAKNSLTGVFLKIIVAALTFYAIPLIIKDLGANVYGIFASVTVIGDLARITNVGFYSALIKFISIQGKSKESSYDIITAFISMIVLMSLISIVLFVFSDQIILNVLNIDIEYLPDSKVLFNRLVISNFILQVGLNFTGILESQKRMYLVSYIQLIYSVIYWSSIILVVSYGLGLREVGLMVMLSAIIWLIVIAYASFKIYGPIHFRGFRRNFRQSIRKLLGYGLKLYASGLLFLFWEPLVKIIVANYFGVTHVGFIDIGIRVKNQFQRIFQALFWPLFQLFSEIRSKEKIAAIVKEIEEKITLFIIPICIGLIFSMNTIIDLWIGENVEIISISVLIITIGTLLGQTIIQPFHNYLGANKPTISILNQVIMDVSYIPFIFLLKEIFAFYGVIISLAIAYLIHLLLGLYFQKKYLNLMIFDSSKKLLKLICVIIILFALGYIGMRLTENSILLQLLIIPLSLLISSFLLYRELRLIRASDIEKYLGSSNKLSQNIGGLFHK